jgi:hypothetical protein
MRKEAIQLKVLSAKYRIFAALSQIRSIDTVNAIANPGHRFGLR